MIKWVWVIAVSTLLTGCINDEPDPSLKTISRQNAAADIQILTTVLKKAHPSLTLYLTEKRFAFLTDSIAASVKSDLTEIDLFNKINYIVNEIGCSHTSADLPGYIYDSLQNQPFFFPYPVKLIDNRLLVNITDHDLPQGTEITFINKEPVSDILKKLMPYNSVEGFHRKTQQMAAAGNFSLEYFYRYGQQKQFDLVIKDTLGITKNITASPVKLSEWNNRNNKYTYYFDPTDIDYDLSIFPEKKYAYLKLTTFSFDGTAKQQAYENFCSNSFALLQNKKEIQSLIIDLRENYGGSLYNAFLLYSYLTRTPINEFENAITKIKAIPYAQYLDENFASNHKDDINHRLEEEFSKKFNNNFYSLNDTLIEQWQPGKTCFNGTVYVITNSNIVSAASYFATMIKNSHRGKIIGEETTGGSFSGNGFTALKYVLPNSKISFEFPYAHILYSFRDEKNTGRGLLPDYAVPDSYESFKKNTDQQYGFIVDSLILNKKQF